MTINKIFGEFSFGKIGTIGATRKSIGTVCRFLLDFLVVIISQQGRGFKAFLVGFDSQLQ